MTIEVETCKDIIRDVAVMNVQKYRDVRGFFFILSAGQGSIYEDGSPELHRIG